MEISVVSNKVTGHCQVQWIQSYIAYSNRNYIGLQKHFHHLEAVALEREAVEDIEDFTKPNVGSIDGRTGNLLEEFIQILSSQRAKPGQKREVSSNVVT